MRGVAEVMYGRLSEGEASRRGAWGVVSWTDVGGGHLLKVSQMVKVSKNFSESVTYFWYTR